ncbi:MAG: HlyD family efflux transporter periplasmic adaptor subunit [Prevotellaceae bacterium]|nr:HlyD family efflux transporter periplasmic adaptor subunit [Prevotellaceae bacterium]
MKTYKIISIAMAALLTACNSNDGDYDASGIFETTEVIVSAKANGEIMALNIEDGQIVRQFVPLGYIDTLQLAYQKDQLRANRVATNSRVLNTSQQIASINEQIAIQKRERKRYEQLVKANAATQKQLDDINYQIQVLEKQLAATSEQINSTNSSLQNQSTGIDAQLAQIDDKIYNSVITSPINGTILTKYVEKGEYAAPGKALFKIADITDMKLRAYVTASQLTSLKIGQKVRVYADQGEADRKEYQGTVTWISDKAEFTPKTIQTRDERANLVYAVKISVKNDGLIKDGMYGDVKF